MKDEVASSQRTFQEITTTTREEEQEEGSE